MAYTSKTRNALEEALALARRSSPREAVVLLARSLAYARRAEDSHSVAILARNAAIISSNAGDLQQAIRYYSEAVENEPGDLYLRLGLADVHRQLGQEGSARKVLAECHDLALLEGDEDILAILRDQGFEPGAGA
jgi:tetratricopeptide (TPR) repeat protein